MGSKTNTKNSAHATSSKLDALTSWRFIAALAVFIYHANVVMPQFHPHVLGTVGVSFFFVLSGFILTYVYLYKLKKFNVKNTLKFYIARIAKLYPVHLMTFFMASPGMAKSYGLAIGAPVAGIVIVAAIMNLLLIHAWPASLDVRFSFNNVSWTISIELLFYALFPFIVALLSRFMKNITKTRLAVAMIFSWLALLILYSQEFYIPSPIQSLPMFLVGMCIAVYFMHFGSLFKRASGGVHTFLEFGSIALLIGSLVAIILVPTWIDLDVLIIPAISLVILVFAYNKGALSTFLSRRIMVFLGEISFSFYMLHMIVLGHFQFIGGWTGALAALSVTVLASSLTYRYVEEPARKRIKSIGEDMVDTNLYSAKIARVLRKWLRRRPVATPAPEPVID